jgi:hypothetical protein
MLRVLNVSLVVPVDLEVLQNISLLLYQLRSPMFSFLKPCSRSLIIRSAFRLELFFSALSHRFHNRGNLLFGLVFN